MDRAWWDTYIGEVRRGFGGRMISPLRNCHGTQYVRFDRGRNSGAGAIALAAHFGARRIILLGYDAQKTNGQAHWHGNHPRNLGNAGTANKWPAQFADMAKRLRGVEIVNASRATAITCWPRVDLEDALCAY